MSTRRKVVLVIIIAILLGVHVALFAAGGTWRTLGLALVTVDVVAGWFAFAAVREMRKLDKENN